MTSKTSHCMRTACMAFPLERFERMVQDLTAKVVCLNRQKSTSACGIRPIQSDSKQFVKMNAEAQCFICQDEWRSTVFHCGALLQHGMGHVQQYYRLGVSRSQSASGKQEVQSPGSGNCLKEIKVIKLKCHLRFVSRNQTTREQAHQTCLSILPSLNPFASHATLTDGCCTQCVASSWGGCGGTVAPSSPSMGRG